MSKNLFIIFFLFSMTYAMDTIPAQECAAEIILGVEQATGILPLKIG